MTVIGWDVGGGDPGAAIEREVVVTVKATPPIGILFGLTVASLSYGTSPGEAQSLRGSTSSLDLQNEVAEKHDYTFIEDPAQVRRFVDAGYLVPVSNGKGYRLARPSFPYARPEVALFVSRLGAQYIEACGEELVITSLTRPQNRQPRNASPRSVHPTGMALDLRRGRNGQCRSWLERVLLQLEKSGVLEASLERRPPHYHVALFPTQYAAYVERIRKETTVEYRVRTGDSLWLIARRHNTSVDELRVENSLRGTRIYPGQVLAVPNR